MYRGETCDTCGMPVVFFTRSYWTAPNDLWNKVVGTEYSSRGEQSVILCPPCFTLAAKAKGISVHWEAVGP